MWSTVRSAPEVTATLAAVVAAAWLLTGCLTDDPNPTTTAASTTTAVSVRSEAVAARWEPSVEPVVDLSEPSPSASPTSAGTLVAHVIGDEIVAYGGPASSRVVASFANPNRHGTPLVFRSLADPGSTLVDSGWIPVLLPMRPNGTVGWIRTDEVELTRNPYRIEVDVDDFSLTVYRNDDVHFRTVVGIGDGDTPTPYGSFYLTDLLKPSDPAGIYGPYAYGLSGFSETLTSFNGGQGVIGIHGTDQPAALGTRVSHGCIRVANESITELASFLPLGTPVAIGTEPGVAGEREALSVG